MGYHPWGCKESDITEQLTHTHTHTHTHTLQITNLKPVNGTAIDEGCELPQAISEGISNGAKGHHNMKIFFAAIHKESKQG